MTELIIPGIPALIRMIRNEKVILDGDLAVLYGTETKVLLQAVKRNLSRFPADFMFQLTREEHNSLRSQIVTLKRGQHRKYMPYAFTEQGVAMLSSVLKSDQAIQVNIAIMRAFVQIRQIVASNKDVIEKLRELEEKTDLHGTAIAQIIAAIEELQSPPPTDPKPIGFDITPARTQQD